MSNAKLVGCVLRQLAILALGDNRRSSVRSDWDADGLRDIFRDYVIEHLANDDAVLVIDETGAAYVPPDVGFATKPQPATRMIAHAIAVSVPFKWIAAILSTVLAISNRSYAGQAKDMYLGSAALMYSNPGAGDDRSPARPRTSPGRGARPTGTFVGRAGTKGPRLHDWCYLELADLEVEEFSSANQGLWTRGLLIRRHIADGGLAFFTTWCPGATSIETLVAVEGHRWAIEDSFETAKNEFGPDHNESISWHGWHRYVSLVMLAFAMMDRFGAALVQFLAQLGGIVCLVAEHVL